MHNWLKSPGEDEDAGPELLVTGGKQVARFRVW